MVIHPNQLKLEGKSQFVQQFNKCTELFSKAFAPDSTKEDWDRFVQERQALEYGIYGTTDSELHI